ncbi:MAG: hypothetical protein ACREJO_06675 [Phycisphaerales bacterium]
MGYTRHIALPEWLASRFETEAAKTTLTMADYIAYLVEFVPSFPGVNKDWVVSPLFLQYASSMLRAPHEEDGA